MRTASRIVLAAVAVALLPSVALAGKARTTRIETRPFYGATVTLEEGVRVFRPLPYHDRVIINPGGRTNLTLGFEENRTFNYNQGALPGSPGGPEMGPGAPYYNPVGGLTSPADVPGAAKRNIPIGRARAPAPPPAKVVPHGPARH